MPKFTKDHTDFDPVIQSQFRKTQGIPFAKDTIIGKHELINWDKTEHSSGANKEWFYSGALSVASFFANNVQVEVHPGWVGPVSRMSALVQNPGANKDTPMGILTDSVMEMQHARKKLYMLDEFSIPALYETMKANDYRVLGIYTEFDSLWNKVNQNQSNQVVDPKTRLIRIYDTNHWNYTIKGEQQFLYENVDMVPRTLFPIYGGVQPEIWFGHVWSDPLSGFWQRWSVVCTPQVDAPLGPGNEYEPKHRLVKSFQTVFENIDTAAKEAWAGGKCPLFTLSEDTYESFRGLYNRMRDIKAKHADDPIVIASASKTLREVVSTMGAMHAFDQGTNNSQSWVLEVPPVVFDRASELVAYHMTVALRCRPPTSARTVDFGVKPEDSADTVALRRTIMRMHGLQMSGTDLKRAGVFGLMQPQEWRDGVGNHLASLGSVQITVCSHGWSLQRFPVPAEEDGEARRICLTMLHDNLRMTVEEYEDTLKPAPPPRRPTGPASAVDQAPPVHPPASGRLPVPPSRPQTTPTHQSFGAMTRGPSEVKIELSDEDEVGAHTSQRAQPASSKAEAASRTKRKRAY